jgi:DNA-binding response OmpR family regulator
MNTDILIISHNELMGQLMQIELSLEGYSTLVEADSSKGFMAARAAQPQLLILDAEVPGLSAIEICNRLQATSTGLKIILLCEGDKALSANLPVDDFIFMPLSLTELLLRVKLSLRQGSAQSVSVLRFEDLSLSLDSYEVYRGERLVELTAKEFDLLTYLLRHPQQVMTRDRLLEKVWDYDSAGSYNVLQVCISSLRNKVKISGEAQLIQTVRGVGYVLKTSRSSSVSLNSGTLAVN